MSLHRGQVGIVRSTWFAPTVAFEVEFCPDGSDWGTRALLLERQVSVEGDEEREPKRADPDVINFAQNIDVAIP